MTGCGESKDPRFPVRGQVTMGGQPVADATIIFESKELGVSQSATTDAEGKYDFATYNSTGLPPGSYKVTVSSGRFLKPGEETLLVSADKKGAALAPKKPVGAIPDKYSKVESSGLSAEVKAGENRSFDFDLKP